MKRKSWILTGAAIALALILTACGGQRGATVGSQTTLLAETADTVSLSSTAGFLAVPSDAWYADAVAYVQANGIINGFSETEFRPDGIVNRGQFTAILYRTAGSPAVSGPPAFSDVAATAYYAEASVWAGAQGIIQGYSDGTFHGDAPVTHQQTAAILWRSAGSPAEETGADFEDENEISTHAATAVDWARANGFLVENENRFHPTEGTTRAEMAFILSRYLQRQTPQASSGPVTSGGTAASIRRFPRNWTIWNSTAPSSS